MRDAVLARAAKLKPRGGKLLELAAVIGTRIEHRILEEALAHAPGGLADCIAVGILQEETDGVAFRHELAREAILELIDPLRRRSLYRTALKGAIKSVGAARSELAQLAHYAEGGADARAVIEYGVAAAKAAALLGAHREAAAQYERVLRFADDRPATERARYLESYAEECATIDNLDAAIKAYQQAIQLRREAGDRLKEGEILAALAWPLVRSGQNAAAEQASQQAIRRWKHWRRQGSWPPPIGPRHIFECSIGIEMSPSNGARRPSSSPLAFKTMPPLPARRWSWARQSW